MDPLSDVLSLLQVSSMLSSRFEARGQWAFHFPSYASQIKFGGVLAGRFQLWVAGMDQPLALEAGDFYLLTNGRPFVSTSGTDRHAMDGSRLYRDHRCADGVVRYDGEGAQHGPLVSFASGRFSFHDGVGDVLLRHLPPLIHLRAGDPGTQPLAALLDMLRWETGDEQPGAAIAKTSLASLVLVQALRIFLNHSPQPSGWLGAMADTRVGAALSQMHGDLARRWTVESLAAVAGMSRTAFAVRFKRLTGAAPLDYLQGWRMTVARHLLTHGDQRVSGIAERVGYQSDTAFNSAFKRATGQSPGRFRSSLRPMGAAAQAG